MKRTITLILSALLLGNNLIAQGNRSISCLPNPKSESGTSIQLKGILSRSKSKIAAVVLSPDSRRLAVATPEKSTELWNMESGQLVAMLDGRISFFFYGDLTTIDAFSHDGQTLITINGKEAKLWDASTGHLRYLLRGHEANIRSTAFSPDGKQVATGSIDGTVKLWDMWTGHLNSTLAAYQAKKYPRWRIISRALSISDIEVYFSADNKHVLTASWDQPTKLWDSSSGQLEAILGEKNYYAKFSPSGRFVLTQRDQVPGVIDLWETASVRLKLTFTSHESDPEFSPNEQWLGFVEYQGYEGLLNLNSMKVEIRLSIHPSFITSTLFNPTSDTFVLASGLDGQKAAIVNVNSGNVVAELQVMSKKGFDFISDYLKYWEKLSFHPSGQILMGANRKLVRFWDSHTGNLIKEIPEGREPAIFSSDGKWLVTASKDERRVLLWEVKV